MHQTADLLPHRLSGCGRLHGWLCGHTVGCGGGRTCGHFVPRLSLPELRGPNIDCGVRFVSHGYCSGPIPPCLHPFQVRFHLLFSH